MASHSEMNSFRNFVHRPCKDQQRQLKLLKLSNAYDSCPKDERHQFVKDFYAGCGTKGDIDGFIEQKVVSSAGHASGQRD
eukprot:1352855-Amphidinium_carterae.1